MLGTDPVHSILPNLKDDNMIAGPATLDSEWYANANLFPILAPYQVQAANGLWYYENKMGGKGKKVCTMTSDDGYGKAGLAAPSSPPSKLGITLTDNETFASALTGGSYDAQVQTLAAEGLRRRLAHVAAHRHDRDLQRGDRQELLRPQWIGTSPTWINLLAQGGTADYAKANYVVVAQGPEWGDTSSQGMKDMLAAVKEFAPKTNRTSTSPSGTCRRRPCRRSWPRPRPRVTCPGRGS